MTLERKNDGYVIRGRINGTVVKELPIGAEDMRQIKDQLDIVFPPPRPPDTMHYMD